MTEGTSPAPETTDDEGPSIEEAKAAAAETPHVDDPDNADLPTDVKDSEPMDTSPDNEAAAGTEP